jgi:type I restriction enzyme S subunit
MKLPNRWKRGIVRDLIGSMDSGVSVNSEDKVSVGGEYGILKTSCVTSGIFDPNENKVIVNDEIDRAKVNPKRGRILMSRMNTSFLVGASAYVPNDYKNLFLPDRLWQIEPKDDRVDMKWLSYVLGSSKYRLKISSVANGTSGSMKNISKGDIEALNIFIPPFQEQGAIAEVLSNWDSAIEKIVRLIITKENYFKELAHELIFNGSKGGKWKPVRLGEVFEERNEINHINLPLLSITRKKGIIPFDAA